MEALITSLLRDYFETLFRDFDAKKDFHFRLAKGEVVCSNLILNEAVVREVIGIETLDVKRLRVSNCVINVTPTKINTVPVVIEVDFVDIVLNETDPRPIEKILSKLFHSKKKQESDLTVEKKEEYSLLRRIADGIQLCVKKIHIVVQCKGPSDEQQDRVNEDSPPLLVLTLENLSIRQTNSQWEVVDLEEARRIPNQGSKDNVFTFRRLQAILNIYLVPCSSEKDASFSLLKGSKLWDFPMRAADKSQGQGPLGGTHFMRDMPIEIRLIAERKLTQGIVALQTTILLDNIKLELDHVQAEMTIAFLLSTISLLRRQTSRKSSKAAKKPSKAKSSKHSKVNFKQLMRTSKKKKRAKSLLSDDNSPGPRIVFHLSVPKIQLMLKTDPELVATYAAHQQFESFNYEIRHLHFAFSNGVSESMTLGSTKIVERQYQLSVQWIEFSATTTSQSYRLVMFPTGGTEIMSGLNRPPLTIHPVITTEDDNPDYRGNVLEGVWIGRTPCPAPPSYGTELQIRLRCIDFVLYEDVLMALLMHLESILPNDAEDASLAKSSTLSGEESFVSTASSTNTSESLKLDASSTSTSAHDANDDELYSTFFCSIDINGPSIYLIPTQLVRPMLHIFLEKIFILGHLDLHEPIRNPNGDALCSSKNSALFPSKPTDFFSQDRIAGQNFRVTKLEVMMRPFGVYYLGDPAEHVDDGKPLLGSKIFEVPQLQGCLFWDFSASPQFQLSFCIDEIQIELRHEQLHVLKLVYGASSILAYFGQLFGKPSSSEGQPPEDGQKVERKKKKRKIKINDFLYLVPNPGTSEIDEEFVQEVSNNILALLPTYIFGFFFAKSRIVVCNGPDELLRLDVLGFEFIFEHQAVSDSPSNDQLLIFKLTVDDTNLWWPSSEGDALSPSKLKFLALLPENLRGESYLVSFRMEQIASNDKVMVQADEPPNQAEDSTAGDVGSVVLDSYTPLQSFSAFIKRLLAKYTFFSDNLLMIRLGGIEYSMKLSTLSVIPAFLDIRLAEIREAWNSYQQGAWTNFETARMEKLKEKRETDLRSKLIRRIPLPYFMKEPVPLVDHRRQESSVPSGIVINRMIYELLDHITANANIITEGLFSLHRSYFKTSKYSLDVNTTEMPPPHQPSTDNRTAAETSSVESYESIKRRIQTQSFSAVHRSFAQYSPESDPWLRDICVDVSGKAVAPISAEELFSKLKQLLKDNPTDLQIAEFCIDMLGDAGVGFAEQLIPTRPDSELYEGRNSEEEEADGSIDSVKKFRKHFASISGKIQKSSKIHFKKKERTPLKMETPSQPPQQPQRVQGSGSDSGGGGSKYSDPNDTFLSLQQSAQTIKKQASQLSVVIGTLLYQSQEISRLKSENDLLREQVDALKAKLRLEAATNTSNVRDS